MDLVSLCPLRATSFVWSRDRGGPSRTVVCKATFELAAGVAHLAEQQEPINEVDGYWDDDPARSLYAPSDLVPTKARADVLLVGRAFAPGSAPVAALVARLRVERVDKAVLVHSDRSWSETGQLIEGPTFTSMPLVYERAAGGPSTWNPVGVRTDARPGADGLARLPNLTPPGFRPSAPGARIAPVGFGPIAPTWPDRVARLGAHPPPIPASGDPLPDDLDLAYFNSAPKDQQLDALRGDERIVLENLDRHQARLATALPALRPRVFVEKAGRSEEVVMSADTLWIDTDRRICTVTWRGTIALEHAAAVGHVVIAMEEAGRPLTPADIEARARSADIETTHVELANEQETTARPKRNWRPVLPFQGPDQARATLAMAETPHALNARPPQPSPPMPAPSVPVVVPPPPRRASQIGAWTPPGTTPDVVKDALPEGAPSLQAPLSALAASNAAAGAGQPFAATSPVAPATAAAAVTLPTPRDIVEMLWYDAAFLPRIRAAGAWKPIVAGAGAVAAEGQGEARDQRREARDRRDALAILRHGALLDAAGLDAALDEATADGTFTPPLVLTGGAIELPFDERETLKATLALVAPFSTGDKKLKELCETTRELLESPWLEKGSSGLDGFVTSLREAFARGARGLAPGHLEAQTERILLEQRRYQKRTLLGEEWIRALFLPAGAEPAIVAYLPESAAKQLPIFVRFRARIVAELRLQLDQHETSASALRVVTLGRVLAAPRR